MLYYLFQLYAFWYVPSITSIIRFVNLYRVCFLKFLFRKCIDFKKSDLDLEIF